MQIKTKYFGEMNIEQEQMIYFPHGLPGFQDEKEFVVLNFEENGLFNVLQSTRAMDPAFIVIDPFLFVKNFEIDINQATIDQLEINKKEEVIVLSIVTVKEPLKLSTANLNAPLVINQSKKIGKQYIISGSIYSTREQIFTKTSRKEGE
ncbi:flagellar assembly protein FliW [Gracilibacillus kekensis]|uniref:Flagellar assembly factor FliW n=1 Tax=Gracilibacillus kekensis TaxID=1027249 RepID=A0A1M7N031_9BACI|nr:flagellar assembly protein FliW [Gracilibacillus kekensis]SHM96710.1 flagellar assembly factor FliW [Gracilibacillus kekensis]